MANLLECSSFVQFLKPSTTYIVAACARFFIIDGRDGFALIARSGGFEASRLAILSIISGLAF